MPSGESGIHPISTLSHCFHEILAFASDPIKVTYTLPPYKPDEGQDADARSKRIFNVTLGA